MKGFSIAGLAATLCASASGISTGAFAQSRVSGVAPAEEQSTTDGSGVSEIIVTAQRREQSLQKASLTIQVVRGDDLIRSGVTDVSSLQKLTPGVNIGMTGGNGQIFIRGVGDFSVSPLSSPGVAFNVDGVYVGRPDGVNGFFYDVARIEVLKGPQGTLYGRNANGGSVNLITNDARLGARTLDLNMQAGNYDLIQTSGAVNLPVGQNAAIRGAFNFVHRDGYLSDGSNDDAQRSGRLRFLWEPNADITVRLSGDYTHLGGKGNDMVYLPRRPGASPYEAQSSAAANAYLDTLGPLAPLLKDIADDNFRDTTLYDLSAQLDWKLSFATLTLLPAYRYLDSNYSDHFAERYESRVKTRQRSLEARLGNASSALTWVIGGYYFRESSPGGVVLVDGGNILQNYRILYKPFTESYAAFGQATVSLTDSFRLIGGIRYTHEKRSLSGSINDQARTPPVVLENFGGRKSFSGTTYKVGAELDLTPRNMLYATYSTGFKSGGFSQTIEPLNVYKPERLFALEIGSRNRFLDNRLQVNLSAFHWKYKDIQDSRVNFDALNNVNFITFNSGDATLYGGTLDIVARPSSSDTITLAGEYVHSRYDRFYFRTPVPFLQPGSTGCPLSGPFAPGATLPYADPSGSTTNNGPLPVIVGDCRGFQMARVPKFTGTASYQHNFAMPNSANLTLGGSVTYSSGRWITIDFIPAARQDAYAVVDADLTYHAADDRWSVGIFGRNLTKTVYYNGGVQASFVGGLLAADIAAPRTYGIRANFRFGS
ncbi:TonB-dependent receptor [Sphingobium ummariense]|uniref:TonB-dependent receptor n=1 Tax=Sphingobium ummariense TaxID=420994 RepID=UPI0004292C12|nr:TonB-dependent receptor [Sphingobium ummariense]